MYTTLTLLCFKTPLHTTKVECVELENTWSISSYLTIKTGNSSLFKSSYYSNYIGLLYWPTVLTYCIDLLYWPTLLAYYIDLLYWPTVLSYCIVLLYRPTVLSYCIDLLYCPTVLAYRIGLLYWHTVLTYYIGLLYCPTNDGFKLPCVLNPSSTFHLHRPV